MKKALIISISLLALLLFGFQNCTQAEFSGNPSTIIESQGNGDSYDGKGDIFVYFDQQSPCADFDRSGQPFPNRQIMRIDGQYQLVRDNCSDIEPIIIADSDISFDPATGRLTYQGQPFNLITDFDNFKLTPLACPNGRAVINQDPTNLFVDPFDIGGGIWANHPQLDRSLNGSFSVLPQYLLVMNDPNNLQNYRRAAQSVTMQPSTLYMTSFLVKPGSMSEVGITYGDLTSTPTNEFFVHFDLQTGVATVRWQVGINVLVPEIQAYGEGFLVRVFFESSAAAAPILADLGVGPARANVDNLNLLGDSIVVANGELYEVDSYCAP